MRLVPHSLLALVLAAGPVSAQPPADPPAEEPAKQLSAKEQAAVFFKEGRAFFKAKQFREAAEKFQAAYNLDPVPILLYNLARASEEMGDPEKAIEHYRFYLKRVGPDAEDRGEVERRVRVMEKTISAARRARVRITGLPPQARILVDGQPVELEDGLVRAEPGERVLRVEPRDGAPWQRKLGLGTGEYVEVLFGEVEKPAEPDPPPPTGPSTRAIAGWSAVGAGGVMMVLGGVFYGQATSAVDDYNAAVDALRVSMPNEQDALVADKDDAESRATTNGTLAYVMWGIGGAALVAGGALLVLEYGDDGAGTEAAVVPLPGGVGITGTF